MNDILNLSLNINLSDFELEIVNTLGEVLFSDKLLVKFDITFLMLVVFGWILFLKD